MTTPSSPPRPSARPRRRSRWPVVLVVLALACGGAYFGWQHYLAQPDPTAGLQLATVTRGDIEDVVTATGTLQPREYVDVGAQVSGQLMRIHVDVGSTVNEGDLLAEIDPTVLQSKVDATRASLRNQRAQLKDREASLALARIQHTRQKNLMAEDATTEEALQTAEAALVSAQAAIEALKAQIEQTESNLRADEANLEYARIYAPMSGTVVSIAARQGQTLNANQQAPTILRIADLNTMTVQTQVSEADVGRLRLGMPAYFTTLGGQGQRWHGQLEKIEPTPEVTNNVVLYNALFDVPNPDRRLMTQMTAQVFFITAQARDALLVPMGALARSDARIAARGDAAGPRREGATGDGPRTMRDGQRPTRDGARPPENGEARAATGDTPPGRLATVRLLNADGSLVERSVRYGVSNRVLAEVLSGLDEGDQVVAGMALPVGTSQQRGPNMPPRL
ncbi:MAG: efflux RND transporter periplasmic adaptor subunit [Rhodocyclaceae bacterium]